MITNYLIHFNSSIKSDNQLEELFGDGNLFINKVLDKVRRDLDASGLPMDYINPELISIHNLTIMLKRESLNLREIEDVLTHNRPNIFITGIIKGSVNDLVSIASASDTQIISLSLPNFRNYKYFKVRSEEEETEHNSENSIMKDILRAIMVDSAAGIIVEIVKTIFQSLL